MDRFFVFFALIKSLTGPAFFLIFSSFNINGFLNVIYLLIGFEEAIKNISCTF